MTVVPSSGPATNVVSAPQTDAGLGGVTSPPGPLANATTPTDAMRVLRPLFAAIDARDWETFLTFLTPDATFQYGALPPAHGTAAIAAAAEGALAPFAHVRHDIRDVFLNESVWIVDGTVHYGFADGEEVAAPFLNRFGLSARGDVIHTYHIYLDPSPVFAAVGRHAGAAAAQETAPPSPVATPVYAEEAPVASSLQGILRVIRAPFLPLAVLLALGGSATQWQGMTGPGSPPPSLLVLIALILGLVAAHVFVNVANEREDWRSGLDRDTERTPFSGGSGAFLDRAVSWSVTTPLLVVSGLIAIACGAFLLARPGGDRLLPILGLGAVIILGYARLWNKMRLGELMAGLGLGGGPVLGAALVIAGEAPLAPQVWALAAAATGWTGLLLFVNSLPDRHVDVKVGRRTLAMGWLPRQIALTVITVSALAALLTLGFSLSAGTAFNVGASLVVTALAVGQSRAAWSWQQEVAPAQSSVFASPIPATPALLTLMGRTVGMVLAGLAATTVGALCSRYLVSGT